MISEYPNIFLSHSKKDKVLIEKLAVDLRKQRINAWYDEWEIPAGSSLRELVFSQGIDKSDAFFVYFTPNSLSSKWVKEELDANFIKLIEENVAFIPCVSDFSLIDNLPLDIQSKKLVLLNENEYQIALIKIITRIYEFRQIKIAKSYEKKFPRSRKKIEVIMSFLQSHIKKKFPRSRKKINMIMSVWNMIEINLVKNLK